MKPVQSNIPDKFCPLNHVLAAVTQRYFLPYSCHHKTLQYLEINERLKKSTSNWNRRIFDHAGECQLLYILCSFQMCVNSYGELEQYVGFLDYEKQSKDKSSKSLQM